MSVTFYPNYIHNAGFDAAAEPSITDETFIASGGETSGGIYDLLDSNRDNLVTFATNGGTNVWYLDLDLTTSKPMDFAIIDNHNLNTADAKYYIWAAAKLGLALAYSGALGSALTSDGGVDNVTTPSADGIGLFKFDGASSADWRIYFDDVATYDTDITMGEIFIGQFFQASYMPEIGLIKSSNFGTNVLQSKGGKKYGFKNYGEARRWQLNWIFISDAEKVKFETLWSITEGMRYPFYIDLGEAATPQLYFVRFAMPELQFTEVPGAWKLNIIIEEEI